MAQLNLVNNYETTLVTAITDTDTELMLANHTVGEATINDFAIDSRWFPLTISYMSNIEIVIVNQATQQPGGGLLVSASRGQDDSIAKAFPAGAVVKMCLTKSLINYIYDLSIDGYAMANNGLEHKGSIDSGTLFTIPFLVDPFEHTALPANKRFSISVITSGAIIDADIGLGGNDYSAWNAIIKLSRANTGIAWPTFKAGGVTKTPFGTAPTGLSGAIRFDFVNGLVGYTWLNVS